MARLIPIVAARQRKHEFMQAARAPCRSQSKRGNQMARLIPIVAARQRKHEFMQAARAIMSVAEKENRELTTAESQNLAKVEAALKDAEARIVLCEQQLAEE